MKVVILAGGFGTRLSEYTKSIPKPLVEINKKPILGYIIEHYVKYGFKDFIIALGYKGNLIKKYFKKNYKSFNIQLVDTGLKTMTGGRLKRLKNFVGNDSFLFTYGDGISNVNLKKLINQHNKTKKLVTLTAVRPPARFGALKIKNENVINFREKSKLDEGWINGGYFIIEPRFLDYIKNDKSFLEREPLELITKKRLLGAYKHKGFWQCVDTKRDKDLLEEYLKKNK
jgi:glucose-1-phosphate cytidylyltransferase